MRDRFGIKPLILAQTARGCIFSSEIQSVVEWTRACPDLTSITAFLLGWGGPSGSRTFFENVGIMRPGTVITFSSSSDPTTERFWRLSDFHRTEYSRTLARERFSELTDRVEAALRAAIERQLAADAPVGAYCSGGVDSSVLVAMASRLGHRLDIFHADVSGPFSERHQAERLAEHLGLLLRSVAVKDHHFLDMLPEVIYASGHPSWYHSNSVAFLMVSRLAREHGMKGMLSGEGADECYMGYDSLVPDVWAALRAMPVRVLRQLRACFRMNVPTESAEPLSGEGVSRLLLRRRLWDNRRRFPAPNQLALVARMLSGFEEESDMAELNLNTVPRDVAICLEKMCYHMRTLLNRNDSLGMAASIEARFPYLDLAVVTDAINLPYRAKVRWPVRVLDLDRPFVQGKAVLRNLARRYLPVELSRQKKWGFRTGTFGRMTAAPALFHGGYLCDLYRLGTRQVDLLTHQADQQLFLRMLHLEVWGRAVVNRECLDAVRDVLRTHVRIHPLGGT